MKILFFVIFLASSLLIVNVALATPPTLPGVDLQWFKYRIEFDEKSLPAGVSINKTATFETNTAVDPEKWIGGWIQNDSDVPLFLFKRKILEDGGRVKINVFPELNAPADLIPILKIVSGSVFYIKYAYAGAEQDLSGKNFKVALCKMNDCEYPTVDSLLYDNSISATKGVYGEGRPNNIIAPTPEPFELLAYYGDKPIFIKGNFVYSLNEHYGQKFSDYSHKSDAKKVNISISIVLVIALLLGYFIVRNSKLRKN